MTIQYHVVAEGETLAGIARQYGLKPKQVRALNHLKSAYLFTGQQLIVGVVNSDTPASRGFPLESYDYSSGNTIFHTIKTGDTLFSIARNYNTTVARVKADNQLSSDKLTIGNTLRIVRSAPQTAQVPQERLQYHTVQNGETLFGISRRYGTTVDALQRLNNLTGTNINPGMRLVVAVQQTGGSYYPSPTPAPIPNPTPIPNPAPKPAPAPISGGSPNTSGVSISYGPNGATLRIPLLGGETITAELRNYKGGFMYHGQSHQIPPVHEIRQIGLDDSTAKALQYCKKVEGNYDAINTYDPGIFSYGFIQFIGKGGVLDKLLQNFQRVNPQKFVQIFERAGIYLSNGRLLVYDERRNPFVAENAWSYIRLRPDYIAPFIQAGFDRQFILEQYRMANQEYAEPALRRNLKIRLSNGMEQSIQLGEIFVGNEARSLLFAMAINLGVGGMANSLSESLSDLARRRNFRDARQLTQLGWQELLTHISQYENSQYATGNNPPGSKRDLTIKRVDGILTGGLDAIV